MSKSAEAYLKHILAEIEYLIKTSQSVTEKKFMVDVTLQRAFARSIEIIGEAAKNLPQEYKQKHNDIDWKSITGMRDKLIHHYFGVDYEIVWDVVENEIPKLRQRIISLLNN